MTPEELEQVRRIFIEAQERKNSAERASYVLEACQGQEEVRAEVESLLHKYEKLGEWLGAHSFLGGETISHYRVLDRIGRGGMGIVYRAVDTRLNRVVAMKVLAKDKRRDAQMRARLSLEGRNAAAFNHPNIVTIYEAGEEDGLDFIVMEYVPGLSLDEVIRRRRPSLGQATHCAIQIASALSAAHVAGFIHGDFKPQNVVVTDDDRVKLLDFGLARALISPETDASTAMFLGLAGTPDYMAPEQLKADDVRFIPDTRCEVFSFGVVLCEMLAGRHPFDEGPDHSRRNAIIGGVPNPLPPGVSDFLAGIVARCLEKDPQLRYPSMKDVYDQLLLHAGDNPSAPPKLFQTPAAQTATAWELNIVRSREVGKETIWRYAWKDIGWIGDEQAWLCGEVDSGGPQGDVGSGILLHTNNGGSSWARIDNDRFQAGRGSFNWGGNKQGWQDIGPISSMHVYPRNLGGGNRQIELWLAATSGIYRSEDGGQSWRRSTPKPDETRYVWPYAHFGNLFRIVAAEEVFAVGWQGISRWSGAYGAWNMQLPAGYYLITAVDAYPNDSPDWDVWAVGQSGDRRNPYHMIYHLKRPHLWEKALAANIEIDPAKGGLRSILIVNHETGFAVGPDGAIVKGVKERDDIWRWRGLAPITDKNLNSIAYVDKTLWIVGDKGIVLRSEDMGQTWQTLTLKDESGVLPPLNRIRFFNASLWIVGNGVVYSHRMS